MDVQTPRSHSSTPNIKTLVPNSSNRTSQNTTPPPPRNKKAAMENFQQLVLKLEKTHCNGAALTPSATTLVKDRLNQFFADYRTPDHPPYSAMIEKALREMNEKGGSSEDSISEFLKTEYNDLPWAHSMLLKHHLEQLCESGDIVLTRCKKYMFAGAEEPVDMSSATKSRRKRKWKYDWEREINRRRKKCINVKKRNQLKSDIVEGNGEDKIEEMQFTENEEAEDNDPEIPPGFETIRVQNLSHFRSEELCNSKISSGGEQPRSENLFSMDQETETIIDDAVVSCKKSNKEEVPIIENSSQAPAEYDVRVESRELMSKISVGSPASRIRENLPTPDSHIDEEKEETCIKELSGSNRALRQLSRWRKFVGANKLVTDTSLDSLTTSKQEENPPDSTPNTKETELSKVIDPVSEIKNKGIKKYDRRRKMKSLQPQTVDYNASSRLKSEETAKLPNTEPRTKTDSLNLSVTPKSVQLLNELEPQELQVEMMDGLPTPHRKMKSLNLLLLLDGKGGIEDELLPSEERNELPRRGRSLRSKDANYVDYLSQLSAERGQQTEYRLRSRSIKLSPDTEIPLSSPHVDRTNENETCIEPAKVNEHKIKREKRGRPPKRKPEATVLSPDLDMAEKIGSAEAAILGHQLKIKRERRGRPPKRKPEVTVVHDNLTFVDDQDNENEETMGTLRKEENVRLVLDSINDNEGNTEQKEKIIKKR